MAIAAAVIAAVALGIAGVMVRDVRSGANPFGGVVVFLCGAALLAIAGVAALVLLAVVVADHLAWVP